MVVHIPVHSQLEVENVTPSLSGNNVHHFDVMQIAVSVSTTTAAGTAIKHFTIGSATAEPFARPITSA